MYIFVYLEGLVRFRPRQVGHDVALEEGVGIHHHSGGGWMVVRHAHDQRLVITAAGQFRMSGQR